MSGGQRELPLGCTVIIAASVDLFDRESLRRFCLDDVSVNIKAELNQRIR